MIPKFLLRPLTFLVGIRQSWNHDTFRPAAKSFSRRRFCCDRRSPLTLATTMFCRDRDRDRDRPRPRPRPRPTDRVRHFRSKKMQVLLFVPERRRFHVNPTSFFSNSAPPFPNAVLLVMFPLICLGKFSGVRPGFPHFWPLCVFQFILLNALLDSKTSAAGN